MSVHKTWPNRLYIIHSCACSRDWTQGSSASRLASESPKKNHSAYSASDTKAGFGLPEVFAHPLFVTAVSDLRNSTHLLLCRLYADATSTSDLRITLGSSVYAKTLLPIHDHLPLSKWLNLSSSPSCSAERTRFGFGAIRSCYSTLHFEGPKGDRRKRGTYLGLYSVAQHRRWLTTYANIIITVFAWR